MKKALLLILVVCFGFTSLYSQSAKDKFKQSFKIKDYYEASKYIKDAFKDNPKDEDLLVMFGDAYFELEKTDSALIMYQKAYELEGDKPFFMRKVAKAYSGLGRHGDAIALIRKAINKDKSDIQNLLALGQAYIKADSLREAELSITRARELNKKSADAYVALGDLYFKQKIYELAKKNYEEAISIDENLIEARINLARTYNSLGDISEEKELYQQYYKSALLEWDNITKKNPGYTRAYYEKGRILYYSQNYQRAIYEFVSYEKAAQLELLGQWYLAHSYFEVGYCDSAINNLKTFFATVKAIKQSSPNAVDSIKKRNRINIDSLNNLGLVFTAKCHLQSKNFTESEECFKQLKSNSYKFPIKELELFAAVSLYAKDTLGSIAVYKELTSIDTTSCANMYRAGQLLRQRENYKEAVYFFKQHNRYCKDSTTPKTLFYLGFCYLKMKNGDTTAPMTYLDTALAYLLESEKLNPKDLLVKVYIGDVYTAMDSTELAKQKFLELYDGCDTDTLTTNKGIYTQAFSRLCSMTLKSTNYKELQKIAKKWTEFDPEQPNGFMFLGIAFDSQGDQENACRTYKKYMQLEPKNAKIKERIRKLNCN